MTVRFDDLSPYPAKSPLPNIAPLWHDFYHNPTIYQDISRLLPDDFANHCQHYQSLYQQHVSDDNPLTDWLITLFNALYAPHTTLIHSTGEPEYFAPKDGKSAQIAFAHGFFASSLHEISHWCVAGKQRRMLDDFGYWYCPDGRDQATQALFEQVEIKPQAIECLLNLALGRYFYVSQDNLNADFDTSQSRFAQDVYDKAHSFLQNPSTLPPDARRLIWVFLTAMGQLPNHQG
ncbi:MAG: elongation factor P hydroxylase [Moraxella sp.]|nr:elongation factor P hydroxylase [Moraxella sp.]